MIKDGASIDGCRAEILIAYIKTIQPLYLEYIKDATITSGSEPYPHTARRSRHYSGDALDIRTRFFTEPQKKAILGKLRERLGDDFVVILEKTHFHIHYAPVFKED